MTLVFFLEELSAKVFLESILPRLDLPENVQIRSFAFEGKTDLEKKLKDKLRCWKFPDTRFVVLRDQDSADCKAVKQNLKKICQEAGRSQTLVRIACHELETFFLGDLAAVGRVYSRKMPNQDKEMYRDPDSCSDAAQEMGRLTNGLYQKVDGARRLGKIISLTGNKSRSFNALISGIQSLITLSD